MRTRRKGTEAAGDLGRNGEGESAATPMKPLPRLQKLRASGVLHLTAEAAAGRAGRSTPHVSEPVELEACVLAQRGHAPPATQEPPEPSDRRGLVLPDQLKEHPDEFTRYGKLLFSEELTGDNKQYEGWEEKATNEAKLRQKLFK